MCGFGGFLGGVVSKETHHGELILKNMTDAIANRGPDDSGLWLDANQRIALGHRRLSIVDLSIAGHQPMHSSNERLVIAFNGEIYNHLELRSELERSGKASMWLGHSDTETLLVCFSVWGCSSHG